MSDVMPSSELSRVANTFDLTWQEIEQLVTNALMSAFAPMEQRKAILNGQVRPWFASR